MTFHNLRSKSATTGRTGGMRKSPREGNSVALIKPKFEYPLPQPRCRQEMFFETPESGADKSASLAHRLRRNYPQGAQRGFRSSRAEPNSSKACSARRAVCAPLPTADRPHGRSRRINHYLVYQSQGVNAIGGNNLPSGRSRKETFNDIMD